MYKRWFKRKATSFNYFLAASGTWPPFDTNVEQAVLDLGLGKKKALLLTKMVSYSLNEQEQKSQW